MSNDTTPLALIVCASLAVSFLLGGLSLLFISRFLYTMMGKGLAVRRTWTSFAQSAGLRFTRFAGQPLYISGVYRGRPIRITARPGSWTAPAYTRATIEAPFAARLCLDALRREMQESQSGEATLDQFYRIESQPAELATLVLDDPALQLLFNQTQPARLFVNHQGVSCQLERVETEAAGLQGLTDLAWKTAEVVQRQIGATIPVEEMPEEPVIPYSAAPGLLLEEVGKGNPKVLLALLVMLPSACLFLVLLWGWLR